MAYARTGYGPGSIGVLQSGAALSYGPTIGSNDPISPQSTGGSRAAYAIPPGFGAFYESGMGTETMLSRFRKLFGGRTAGQARVMAAHAPMVIAARPAIMRMISDTNLESTVPPPIEDQGLPTEDMQLTSLETAPSSPWPWVIGGVLLLGAIGGGAWYFLKYRKQEE